MGIVVVVQRNPQLMEIVLALGTSRCFTSLLYGRQQQGNQNGDDGDNDQQFNQCERGPTNLTS